MREHKSSLSHRRRFLMSPKDVLGLEVEDFWLFIAVRLCNTEDERIQKAMHVNLSRQQAKRKGRLRSAFIRMMRMKMRLIIFRASKFQDQRAKTSRSASIVFNPN